MTTIRAIKQMARTKRFFRCPAALQSAVEGIDVDAESFHPNRYRKRSPIMRNQAIVASIALLLARGRPFDVARHVIAVIINAVKGKSLAWTSANISQESAEVTPCWVYRYSSPAIEPITRRVLVYASLNHTAPSVVLGHFFQAFRVAFSGTATATPACSLHKIILHNFSNCPTATTAQQESWRQFFNNRPVVKLFHAIQFTIVCTVIGSAFLSFPYNASAQLVRKEQIEDVFAVRDEDAVIPGNWQFTNKLFFDADSPAQITANQNNYSPGSKVVSRLSSDATRSITGISDGATSQLRILANIGSSDITLVHESASSTAANRFTSVTGSDLTLGPAKLAILVYDATSTRWRTAVLGAAGGGVGSPGGSDTHCQFNDAGGFGGDAGCLYDKTTDVLTVLGGLIGGDCGINCLTWNTSAITGFKTWIAPNVDGTITLNESTGTFTNKTFDAEASGNTLTIPFKITLPAAGCDASTAGTAWDLPTAGGMGKDCLGTGARFGVLTAADSATSAAFNHTRVPPDLTGAVDVLVTYTGSTSSGNNIRTQVSIACVGENEDLLSPTFNTASAQNTAGPTTAGQKKTVTFTAVSVANCTPGEYGFLKLERIGADAGDTYTGVAQYLSVEITARRAM